MGMKKIWDGKDLPPEGCQVLAHLASQKAWVRHVVTGYKVTEGKSPHSHRIEIQLGESDDPRSAKNARLLGDIRPLDDVEGALSTQADAMEGLTWKVKQYAELFQYVERLIFSDIPESVRKESLVGLLEEMDGQSGARQAGSINPIPIGAIPWQNPICVTWTSCRPSESAVRS